ncbi:MAG: putative quinol monooxygenase [Hyphomicrobiaceae bacterium]
MIRRHGTLAACALLAIGIGSSSSFADTKLRDGTVLSDKPLFIVSYIEVAPGSADKAAALIKKQAAASASEAGNLRFESLQRIGRKNHFVVLETWSDPAARNNHAKAAHTVAYRKALQPLLYNPYDERPHVGLVAADPSSIAKGTGSSVYAITHVDIIPPEQFPPCKCQVKETGPCGNALVEQLVTASRKHKGVVRFDALTQSNRSNHMTVVEQWNSEAERAAHQVTSDVKDFRDALSGIVPGSGVNPDPLFVLNPMTGSLYDERLYTLID